MREQASTVAVLVFVNHLYEGVNLLLIKSLTGKSKIIFRVSIWLIGAIILFLNTEYSTAVVLTSIFGVIFYQGYKIDLLEKEVFKK